MKKTREIQNQENNNKSHKIIENLEGWMLIAGRTMKKIAKSRKLQKHVSNPLDSYSQDVSTDN